MIAHRDDTILALLNSQLHETHGELEFWMSDEAEVRSHGVDITSKFTRERIAALNMRMSALADIIKHLTKDRTSHGEKSIN